MKTKAINILITGDFCPINRMEELSHSGHYDAIFNDFAEVFQGNDLNVVDLECPLTLSNKTRPKTGPYQKAHPNTIKALKFVDVSLVAMANNHIMDYDSDGVEDTLNLCEKNNIATIGVGASAIAAGEPYSTEIRGKKIALLNYADNEFLSTTDRRFMGNAIDPIQSHYDIQKAKKTHDFVLVIVHAGNEFYKFPSPRTKKLYRYLSDQGADVVIAHHTHVFSGYEIYNGKPIFYGLGNFVYDWPGKINSPWNRGYVVRLSITDKVDFEIIPLKQNNDQPGVFRLNKEEHQIFLSDIQAMNQVIDDDAKLESEFQAYCDSVFPMYDAFIEPYFGPYVTALQKRGWLPKMLTRQKRLFHLNLSRCESHRDVLLRMLRKYE